ncbi:DUF4112 domain-containing protein [Sandarakinorhabdus sp.]|uniref:DUF4112 domain-containing protein n=1 Tax=Sandarakinorhabdus sp. TaxID=1916663 RepID=UPI0033406E66
MSTLAFTASNAAAAKLRIARLEQMLEGMIRLPIIGRRIGLDALIGLVPGIGDAAAGALGLYVIWEARNLGASNATLLRMLANVGIETALGSVPVVGDVFDVFFRSNTRNLKLIKRLL